VAEVGQHLGDRGVDRHWSAGEDGLTVGVDRRMRLRRLWAGACLVVVVAACGGGSLTLSEYAEQAEKLVTVGRERIDALDAERESRIPTLEGGWTYWDRRMEARVELLEGFQALDPPDEAVELHRGVVDLFRRLTAAEEVLAARVATFETIADLEQMWETPEGQVARAADEELFAICHVAQAELDATEEREVFANVPWIPSEMKEVVRVTLGCPP